MNLFLIVKYLWHFVIIWFWKLLKAKKNKKKDLQAWLLNCLQKYLVAKVEKLVKDKVPSVRMAVAQLVAAILKPENAEIFKDYANLKELVKEKLLEPLRSDNDKEVKIILSVI